MSSLDQPGALTEWDTRVSFFDGNVVLLGHGGVGFKVHKSVLAFHSEVFSDMFGHSLPSSSHAEFTDQKVEGCPVIPLDDTSYDIAQLLLVMYGRNQLTIGSDIAFPVLAALLRVGDKYGAHAVVEKCSWYFMSMLPATLDRWDNARECREECGFEDQNAVEMLNVLHRVSSLRWLGPPPAPDPAHPDLRPLDSPLPVALFLCAQLGEEELRSGTSRVDGTPETLSDADVECIVRMQGELRLQGEAIVNQALTFTGDPKRCERSLSSSYVDPWLDTYEDERERYPAASECQEAYEECFVDYMSEEVEGEYLDGDPFDTWIRTRTSANWRFARGGSRSTTSEIFSHERSARVYADMTTRY
ncbi:hypothetical protein OH76DRAFT_1488555 [Lentinus brumalis]|uniref:BTB domain-containing protein n=1 Tax=Lentinus brumalis TaxID=2498619 RepID=A0A371CQM8_9APHY|nr:hypothetical protein OH76DRAFT_1488555 [Polyporus brumalis]